MLNLLVTPGNSGTHMINGTMSNHFNERVHVSINQMFKLDYCLENSNFAIYHPNNDYPNKITDILLARNDIISYPLIKRDTFDWALSRISRHYEKQYGMQISEDENNITHHLIYDKNSNDVYYELYLKYIQEQQENIKITSELLYNEVVNLNKFYTFIHNVHQCTPIIYYEDLCDDPVNELKKWDIKYIPGTGTVRRNRPNWNIIFNTDVNEFKPLWYDVTKQFEDLISL